MTEDCDGVIHFFRVMAISMNVCEICLSASVVFKWLFKQVLGFFYFLLPLVYELVQISPVKTISLPLIHCLSLATDHISPVM